MHKRPLITSRACNPLKGENRGAPPGGAPLLSALRADTALDQNSLLSRPPSSPTLSNVSPGSGPVRGSRGRHMSDHLLREMRVIERVRDKPHCRGRRPHFARPTEMDARSVLEGPTPRIEPSDDFDARVRLDPGSGHCRRSVRARGDQSAIRSPMLGRRFRAGLPRAPLRDGLGSTWPFPSLAASRPDRADPRR